MQPNATRPVMDVARRPPSSIVPRTPVRKAPASQNYEPKQTIARQPVTHQNQQQVKKPNLAKPQVPSQPKTAAPVGIIVMSLLVMMVLMGLAIIIYLTSQI